jgi:hypothetical protein
MTDPRGIIHGVERGGHLQRNTPLKTKTRLRIKGISDTAELKDEIQCLVRDIVIIRDGGCLLRNYPGQSAAASEMTASSSSRLTTSSLERTARPTPTPGSSSAFAKVRTVGRKWHEREYNALLKERTLPADRVALWERCERDSWKPVRTGA